MDELTASQRYYQTHKEQRKEYGRKYYQENKTKILEGLKKKKTGTKAPEPEIKAPVLVADVSGSIMVSFS